jgi:hypothetical protein
MKDIIYKLVVHDSGYGGPGDGRTYDYAYFTNLIDAINFFIKSDILYDHEGHTRVDFKIGKYLYLKRTDVSNLGRNAYELKIAEIKVNPESIKDL